jgi:hypothetical protein
MALRKKRIGRVHYNSAGAFAQMRLDKYLQENISNFNGAPFTFPTPGYGGPPPPTSGEITIKNKAALHIVGEGLFYTTTLDTDDPIWLAWTGGLTTTQLEAIDKMLIVPDGTVYVLNHTAGVDTFLAWAPGIGSDFTLLENYTSIVAKFSGSTDNIHVMNIGCDLSSPNTVVYAISMGGENVRTFLGMNGSFSTGATLTLGNTNDGGSISYGAGEWCISIGGKFAVFEADDSALIVVRTTGPYTLSRHCRVGVTDKTYHWDDAPETGGTGQGIARGVNNCLTMTNNISQNLGNNRLHQDWIVCDHQTGLKLMARDSDYEPLRSYNGGNTWLALSAIPGYGDGLYWYFDVALDDENIWLAGSNTVQYTEDFGSSWVDKTGNLGDLVTLIQINAIKLVP